MIVETEGAVNVGPEPRTRDVPRAGGGRPSRVILAAALPALPAPPAPAAPAVAVAVAVSALVLGLAVLALPAAAQTTHDLPLVPANVHWGYYDAALAPVLTIRSGDRVRLETLVARGLDRLRMAGIPASSFTAGELAVEEAVTERGPGAHPLTGPIRVVGAEAGDMLEVRILDVEPMTRWGVSGFLPGGGTLPDVFTRAALRRFELDPDAGVARMEGGEAEIPLRPFFGSFGVAPPALRGRLSSRPPDYYGGNLDNKELVAGTTLYLPVHVDGALLSIGDGHAAQGDGEVSGTAIETSMRGTVEIHLHRGGAPRWPRAETPTHYVSMGLHADLDEAARLATLDMVDFLVEHRGMSPDDAYVLCSVALDLRITQLVDGTKGVHGMLAKAVLR